ncbi:MAG: hypothetical protein JSW51_13740 [Gemmatimonadota bacterium]|nr:MAG: hypothetical protein JSW51_13740 [Gemmatimonadota bacterium]
MMAFKSCRVALCLGVLASPLTACSEPHGPEQSELNANFAKWQSANVGDYEFRFQRLCFCAFIEPVTIEVRAGQIASVVHADSGTVVDTTQLSWYFLTVDGLFEAVQDAIDREAHSLTVEYHVQLGYPTSIDIDYSLNVADEEVSFRASEVEGL